MVHYGGADDAQLLIDNGVLSVPVFDNKTGRYTKFVDILDILTFVMKELGKDVMKTGYETVASNPVFAAQCKSVAGTLAAAGPFLAAT